MGYSFFLHTNHWFTRRGKNGSQGVGPQSSSVQNFFINLYWSAGESMTSKTAAFDGDDEKLREDLLRRLVDQQLLSPNRQILEHSNPEELPMRELPHGNISNLFLMYLAYCRAMSYEPSSRSTFYSVATSWKSCLRFHRKSTHSLCAICSSLRAKIHDAKETWRFIKTYYGQCPYKFVPSLNLKSNFHKGSQKSLRGWPCCRPVRKKDFQQHAILCDQLLGHYSQQWRDRSCYWIARDRSQLHGDLLCIIVDSYDKAKCLLPRFPFQRTPKRTVYETYKRDSDIINGGIFRNKLGIFVGFQNPRQVQVVVQCYHVFTKEWVWHWPAVLPMGMGATCSWLTKPWPKDQIGIGKL